MAVTAARIIDEHGSIAATIDGMEWSALTPASYFWPRYQEWLDAGNTPAPHIPPPPDPPKRDLEQELDSLQARIDALERRP